jgi:hypothetical protein
VGLRAVVVSGPAPRCAASVITLTVAAIADKPMMRFRTAASCRE